MVDEVERKLFEIKSLLTVVVEALTVKPELLIVVRVVEVERKLLDVSSPEIVTLLLKVTFPEIVASVAELVRRAVDETSPVPRIRNIVDELTWKLMKSPLKGVIGLAPIKVPETEPD